MAAKYPIVIYGMSGYTGKLIAEYLTKRHLPFVAAGRDRSRLEAALKEAPGEHVADVQAVEHEEAALTRLFTGAKVVIAVVGPFGQLGEPVLRAALASGAHYLDTTGEQDWALLVRDKYGEAFAAKHLVCAPGCSYMWTAGMIAAEVALEDPSIHTLDILYAPKSMPTIASTLSFLRMLCQPNPIKLGGQMAAWPLGYRGEVVVPGRHTVHVGLPWGGGFEPIWLEHDARVLNCQVQVAFEKGPLVDFVIGRMDEYRALSSSKSAEEMEQITNAWGMAIATTPPREMPPLNTNIISVWARGTNGGRHVLLYSTSAYLSTGALCAESAKRILNGQLKAVGFQPATRAFGHRELMTALAEDGLHCWDPKVA
ncbi:MAG TPA: DUF5938 domain-containing protein [Steroidobacteraceae bacterium]|nr:DUF5938 domain-containing protein [Steroidobacteraceae bacterium]